MTLYCGIDLHGNNSVVAVLDENDQTVYERRLANDLATIIGVLRSYQAELAACVVESTYNWYWLVDGLMEAGFEVRLAHTSAMPQYAGLKYSNDFSDARQLAHPLGNYRVLATMAAELLALACQQELTQLDEKLYLEAFAAAPPRSRKSA